MIQQMLLGHHSQQTAYIAEDYPYGRRLRTQKYYWIDSREGFGDRLATMTINPKTNTCNKVHYSTYSAFYYLFLDEKEHVKQGVFNFHDPKKVNEQFDFILNSIGLPNLTDVQQKNIRHTLTNAFIADTYYDKRRVDAENKEAFDKWSTDTVTYMMNCPFAEILNYPANPLPKSQNIAQEVIVS